MLPDKKNEKWKLLVTGSVQYQLKALPLGLMLSRLKRENSGNISKERINSSIDELYSFMVKYENIFSEDIKTIFK